MKLLRKLVLYCAVLFGCLLTLGYISNWLTRDKCEAQVARRMLDDFGLGQIPLYQINLMPPFPAAAADVFRAAGLKISECGPERLRTHGCFPWAEMNSRNLVPFVVTIRWACADAPLSGGAKLSTFVCLFGKMIRISEEDLLVS
ncbi:MAG: hypothetical protein EHM23_29490 [Acidobacteria bacterium]|nr:MAG: hypothetical protein EHM23_29490 [Acidobacteriota bacterium]